MTMGRRQLHMTISRELVKPSSPTPRHLKKYNFSTYDQIFSREHYMPMIMFYPNRDNDHSDKTLELKTSLSHTLTKYYPFAGRYHKDAAAHVDCNDNGAEFFTASVDTTLSNFLENFHYEDLNQLCPHALDYSDESLENDQVVPLMVQANQFKCGGVAVSLSLNHRIADATTLGRFTEDWARMNSKYHKQQEFPDIDPEFLTFEYNDIKSMGLSVERAKDSVTRTFTFPNEKVNELKLKVKAMAEESGQPISDLSRMDSLFWLLYKCAVAAGTNNCPDSFKAATVCPTIDIRSVTMEKLPDKCVGNFYMLMVIPTKTESEMKPEYLIGELKKQQQQFQRLRNIEDAFALISPTSIEEMQRAINNGYDFSTLCGLPAYEIDFGWGKPVKATIPGYMPKNCIFLMDALNTDDVQAIVSLGKQDMDTFLRDPELLAFCQPDKF